MQILKPLALATLLLLAACSKVTVENYDRLKTGMSYDEVKDILGKPAECNDILGVKNCQWGDEKSHINVSFVGDKVLVFAAEGLR